MSLNLYDSQTKQLTPLAGNARNPVQGATSTSNGVSGLVPTPLAGDQDKYLKGDGTWGVVEAGGAGHVIVDSEGTEYTQRDNLVIEDGWVEDDSTNDATILRSDNFIGTQAEWNALTSAQKAKYKSRDITDGQDGIATVDYVNNTNKVTRFEVSSSSWTEDTTSQSGTTLYKKSISLNNVYVSSPSVDIGSTGVLPSSAEQDAYNLLQYVTCDDTVPCLYLYASDTPSTAFYINVQGVD